MKRSHNQLLFNTLLALFVFILNTIILSQVSQSVHSHYFDNNFSGGQIIVNSQTRSNLPFEHIVYPDDNNWYSATAIDNQFSDNYYRIFHMWKTNGQPQTYSITTAYNYWTGSNGGALYNINHQAFFLKLCYLSFSSAGGTVYVNGSHSSPYSTQVIELNSVYATANGYSSGGIDYTFDHWMSEGSSYSSTITATAHATYTAAYTRMASVSAMNFTLVSGYGDPPTMTWNEHQSTDVTKYRIYRTTKDIENDVLIAELNRGTTSFTDYDRIIRNSGNGILTFYRLRVLLTPENLESSEWGQTCYTIELDKDNSNDKVTAGMTLIPEDYSISAYPNPFNPTTTINYQLPQDGFVTIKVYDVLGREVAALVNENKTAGYYNVGFNASSLTSGVYIYTITANNFVQSKKLLLMK